MPISMDLCEGRACGAVMSGGHFSLPSPLSSLGISFRPSPGSVVAGSWSSITSTLRGCNGVLLTSRMGRGAVLWIKHQTATQAVAFIAST